MTQKIYWHIHHEVLLESATEPIQNRIDYIKNNKPKHEQATRLRLLRPVVNVKALRKVPAYADLSKADADLSKARADLSKAYADLSKADADLSKADADWSKAYADWSKARADWSKAYADWSKAYADWSKAPAVLALHAKECPNCPWDGRTIFPEA